MEQSFFGNEIEGSGEDFGDVDCSGGVYRCRDNIKNFKIRVKLRRVDNQTTSTTSTAGILIKNKLFTSCFDNLIFQNTLKENTNLLLFKGLQLVLLHRVE